MTLDKQSILDSLRKFDRRERWRAAFGQSVAPTWKAHRCRLNPPLDAAVVEAFEKQHGISLPEDYKFFITTIGNGGAGPDYGLFRFGEYDDSDDADGGRKWDDGRFVGDVGQSFPYVEAWNLPQSFWDKEPRPPAGTPIEEEDRLMDAWHRRTDEHYWNPRVMNGAIPLCHRGCGLFQWLVVHGAERGYVWDDDRADDAGLSPLLNDRGEPMTFSDWYLDWLHSDWPSVYRRALASHRRLYAAELRAEWNASHYFSERVFLGAMAVSGLPGVAIARWYDWPIFLCALTTAGAALTLVAGLDRLLTVRRQ